jgi:hypothetical protein
MSERPRDTAENGKQMYIWEKSMFPLWKIRPGNEADMNDRLKHIAPLPHRDRLPGIRLAGHGQFALRQIQLLP